MKPNELFTLQSLLTMGGASLGVTLVGNVAQYVFRWNPRWLGLLVAFAIAALTAVTKPTPSWVDGVVAFFQGLQIFAAAVGIAGIAGAAASGGRTRSLDLAQAKKGFWFSWY